MSKTINDLIEVISSNMSYGEILAAEQLAKISVAITKERIERGLTQKEFAELLGVSQGMVSKWESEDYNFTIEGIAKICEKLNWKMSVELTPNAKNNYSRVRKQMSTWNNVSQIKSGIDLEGAA